VFVIVTSLSWQVGYNAGIFLNQLIQFYSNNATKLRQLQPVYTIQPVEQPAAYRVIRDLIVLAKVGAYDAHLVG